MDENLRAQIELYLPRLDALMRRGHELRDALGRDPSSKPALINYRMWQQDVGITVNELSGGSKAHWLARAFSEAFLLRSTTGGAVEGADPAEIAGRLIDVLKQGVASLTQLNNNPSMALPSGAEPIPHRFDFVHKAELRPLLEQAYADSRRALEENRYHDALLTGCGILEAIVTDALEHQGQGALQDSGKPPGKISDWSFDERLAVAEKSGLIRGGCARLPPIARTYRSSGMREVVDVSERDARVVGQVLRVVMRDLDPGR
jgi:hypothetical protein